jgi:serine/threonine-protein kinase RsbW
MLGASLDQDDVGALELAVTEAASNIMRHAYHGNQDQSIQVEAEALLGKVRLRLWHQGDSFDPSTAALPMPDGSRESGYGVFMIAQSVDDVRYYSDDLGRNCIELTKTVKSPRGEREH